MDCPICKNTVDQDDHAVSCSSCEQTHHCECLSADDLVRNLNDKLWTMAHNTRGGSFFANKEFQMVNAQLNEAKEMFVCKECKGGECETDRQRIEALTADTQDLKMQIMALKEEVARLKN